MITNVKSSKIQWFYRRWLSMIAQAFICSPLAGSPPFWSGVCRLWRVPRKHLLVFGEVVWAKDPVHSIAEELNQWVTIFGKCPCDQMTGMYYHDWMSEWSKLADFILWISCVRNCKSKYYLSSHCSLITIVDISFITFFIFSSTSFNIIFHVIILYIILYIPS